MYLNSNCFRFVCSEDVGVSSNDVYLAIGNETRETIRKPKRTEVQKTNGMILIQVYDHGLDNARWCTPIQPKNINKLDVTI